MAALAVVGAIIMGCAGEDMANEAPQAKNGNKVIQTTTISLGGSAGTRALDANGKKTFAVGDQIAIFYKNTSDELQLANSAALTANDISSDGKTATIKVEMTDPKPESQLRYIYPAAMGRTDYDPAEEIENTINYEKLSDDQDGTLATLASKFDLAVYDGKLTSNSELPGSATLKNLLAIAEFTFKDYTGQKDINSLITKLTIRQMQGDNSLTINRTAAAGPIYVAMSPCSDEDISIIATDGTNSYEKTATAKSLAANTMTPVTMKMQKVVDLSKLTADYEAQDGDILTKTLGTNVKISIADGAEIALRDMAINGVSSLDVKWAGITCLGNATIILKDGSKNTVRGFYEDYPGIQAGPTGKTLVIKGETEGTGSLNASSNRDGAGIGGGNEVSCGNIDIQGGTITATGGINGAGIGGGPLASCGNITISGGTIEATSQYGASIGSGNGGIGNDPTSCGNITISGGTVKATCGEIGVGIGCGDAASCGNITITGGTVEATGQYGAGIGSTESGDSSCGDITISGGTVKATSISNGAGIGNSYGKCGNITISGGTVEATGANKSAGIGGGSGSSNTCGTITITTGVTKVTATKGKDALYSIGRGHSSGTCGTVTIGGDATTYAAGVAESPFVYPTPSVALSAVTSTDYLGWRICSDGKAYAAAGPLPSGVTAVAMIAYVGSETAEAANGFNHGLALALSDASTGCKWKTSETDAGHAKQSSSTFTEESGLQYNATHNSNTYPAFKAAITYSPAAPTGCSSWFLASGYQWQKMAGAVGGYNNLGLQSDRYWSSSEGDTGGAWRFDFDNGIWGDGRKGDDVIRVRACLAF